MIYDSISLKYYTFKYISNPIIYRRVINYIIAISSVFFSKKCQKYLGTLPFIYRPGTSATPDESTMSIIRRLIYRGRFSYYC